MKKTKKKISNELTDEISIQIAEFFFNFFKNNPELLNEINKTKHYKVVAHEKKNSRGNFYSTRATT